MRIFIFMLITTFFVSCNKKDIEEPKPEKTLYLKFFYVDKSLSEEYFYNHKMQVSAIKHYFFGNLNSIDSILYNSQNNISRLRIFHSKDMRLIAERLYSYNTNGTLNEEQYFTLRNNKLEKEYYKKYEFLDKLPIKVTQYNPDHIMIYHIELTSDYKGNISKQARYNYKHGSEKAEFDHMIEYEYDSLKNPNSLFAFDYFHRNINNIKMFLVTRDGVTQAGTTFSSFIYNAEGYPFTEQRYKFGAPAISYKYEYIE